MATQTGFESIGNTPFVYLQSSSGASVAYGLDSADGDKWKISLSTTAGVLPTTGPLITIDPIANGDITFSPNGSGHINAKSSAVVTTGGVVRAAITTGTLSALAPTANGQLMIGASTGSFAWATLTAGTNITITPGPSTITIDASSGGSFTWNEVTGTSQAAAVNHGYITNNAGVVTVTLPSTAAIGDTVRILGKGAGGWVIAQNSGQTIYFGNKTTTTGIGGSLSSTNRRDAISLVCVTANNDWGVIDGSQGNIDFV